MEVVLTRLRDFSCKEASFEYYNAAEIFRAPPLTEETCREEQGGVGKKTPLSSDRSCDGAARLDIESALAWLRRELMEMRSQDQALIRQLMDLHTGIQELKQECAVDDDVDEESDGYEEQSWDSDSEAGESSASSYSGEISFCASIYSNFNTSPLVLSLSKRKCRRRSSVP